MASSSASTRESMFATAVLRKYANPVGSPSAPRSANRGSGRFVRKTIAVCGETSCSMSAKSKPLGPGPSSMSKITPSGSKRATQRLASPMLAAVWTTKSRASRALASNSRSNESSSTTRSERPSIVPPPQTIRSASLHAAPHLRLRNTGVTLPYPRFDPIYATPVLSHSPAPVLRRPPGRESGRGRRPHRAPPAR